MKKHLISVLEKRLKKVVTRQKTSFYDKIVYKLYRHYTKKAPNQELITSVKPFFHVPKKSVPQKRIGFFSLWRNTWEQLEKQSELVNLERERNRLIKYSLLAPEQKIAYNGGKLTNIDETLKYQAYQERYKISLGKLRSKHEAGEKIRVGFLVIWDSVFQVESLYLKMLKDDFFLPKIVVVPARGFDLSLMKQSYAALKEKYGDNVICGFNEQTNEYVNIDDDFDLITPMNPYPRMEHPLSSTQRFADLGIPTFFVNYMPLLTLGIHSLRKGSHKNLTWRLFPQERNERESLMDNHLAGSNVVFLGWPKMDAIADVKKKERNRKKIIIAPHHSISTLTVNAPKTAMIEKYADFFLSLPERYPQIDWVFRPHPVLFDRLKTHPDWGEQRCREYIDKMTSFPNVEYQNGGEYFDTFVNSDGLIHDCMSFLAEYMFTGHPCCFLKKREGYEYTNKFFDDCVNRHYAAFEEEDIVSFIENVVLNGDDPMKDAREAFFEADLKGLYPHSTDAILNYLKNEIKNA